MHRASGDKGPSRDIKAKLKLLTVSQLDKCLKFKSIREEKNDCTLYKIATRSTINVTHLSSCGTTVGPYRSFSDVCSKFSFQEISAVHCCKLHQWQCCFAFNAFTRQFKMRMHRMITYQKAVAFKPPDESFWVESGSNASANSSILSLFPEIWLEANGAELHDSCTFFLRVSFISSIFFRSLFSNSVLISLRIFSSISLCTFQILGGCQGRRTGVGVTTVSNS